MGTVNELSNLIGKVQSYVGMIIYSVTLNTMDKVIEVYGGVTWVQIEGKFLLGQSTEYEINTTGGEATHTLTTDEMPSHTHGVELRYPNGLGGSSNTIIRGFTDYNNFAYWSSNWTTVEFMGSDQPHNNLPPYRVVYIWERTV